MKTNLKKKRILAGFFVLTLMFIFLSTISLASKQNISTADAVDYSIPITSKIFKKYKSNIPDAWYDATKLHGMDTENYETTATAGIDLISLDGTKNYANCDGIIKDDNFANYYSNDIIELKVGEALEFYVEVGLENYLPKEIIEGFKYNMYNYEDNLSLVATQEYNGVTRTFANTDDPSLVDSQEATSTPQSVLDVNGVYNNYVYNTTFTDANKYYIFDDPVFNPISTTYEYNYSSIHTNDNFRLPKVTLTAKNVGMTAFKIACNGINFSTDVTIFINIVDENEGGKIDLGNAEIKTDVMVDTNNYLSTYYKGSLLNGNYIVPMPINTTFSIKSSDIVSNIKTETYDYTTNFVGDSIVLDNLTTTSQNVYIENKQTSYTDENNNIVYVNNFYLTFLSAGEAEFTATITLSLNQITNSGVETEKFERTIKFKLLGYDNNQLIPTFSKTNLENQPVYPTNSPLDLVPTELKKCPALNFDFALNSSAISDPTNAEFSETGNSDLLITLNNQLMQNAQSNAVALHINNLIDKDVLTRNETTPILTETEEITFRAERLDFYNTTLKAELITTYYGSISKTTSIEIKNKNELYPAPIISFQSQEVGEQLVIDLGTLLDENISFNISNISSLENATVSAQCFSANISMSSDNASFEFLNPSIGVFTISVNADYGNNIKSNKTFTLVIKNSSSVYSSDITTFSLHPTETGNIKILKNELLTEEELDLHLYFDESICTLRESETNKNIILLTAVSVGIDKPIIVIEKNNIILASLNFDVSVTPAEVIIDESLLVAPVITYNETAIEDELVIDLSTVADQNITFEISNFEFISEYATIDVEEVYGNIQISPDNNSFTFTNRTVGIYTIKVIANFKNGIDKTTTFTLKITDNQTAYTVNNSKLTLVIGNTSNIEILNNSLSTIEEDLDLHFYFDSTICTLSESTTANNTIVVTAIAEGIDKPIIVIEKNNVTLASITLNITVNAPEIIIDESLLVAPQIKYNGTDVADQLIIDLSTVTNKDLTFSIANYDAIGQHGLLLVDDLLGNVIVAEDYSTFTFNNKVIGIYSIKTIADYGKYGKKSTIFTLILTERQSSYSLDTQTVTIEVGDFSNIGVLKNSGYYQNDLNFHFYTDSSICTIEKSDSYLKITGIGAGIDKAVVVAEKNNIVVLATLVNVIVKTPETAVDINASFVQGNNIRLMLSENASTSTLEVNTANIVAEEIYFTWLSFNSSIVEVTPISANSATISAKRQGTTTIVAVCQLPNGSSVNAVATVSVLNEQPTIEIDFTKDTETAFNIYDLINVSLNTSGFSFSGSETITWSLDGEQLVTVPSKDNDDQITLSSKDYSFYYKLSEGLHTFSVNVIDSVYSLELTAENQINITTISDLEQTLSFSEEQIYLLFTGSKNDLFSTEVLLDGIRNDRIDYSWSVDDTKVVRIMTNGGLVSIEPLKEGETTLVVFCDIGRYASKIIRAELKINIEIPNAIVLQTQSDYPKPGNDLVIDVLVNGRTNFKNFSPNIAITENGEAKDFDFENSSIKLQSTDAGKYSIKATFNDFSDEMELTVSNFNMKEFLLKILPYLIIGCILAIGLYTFLKLRSDPFNNVQKTLTKLNARTEKALTVLAADSTQKIAKKEYSALYRYVSHLTEQIGYYYSEGYDDFHSPINTAVQLKNIFKALLDTVNISKVKPTKVLNTIKNQQLNSINIAINEIIESQIKYKSNIAEIHKKDIEELKALKKKAKSDKNDRVKLLINQGIFDDEDGD